MNLLELFMIALAVSMDAFAVSICKGLSMQKMNWKNAFLAGLYFGGFQTGMPLFGYLLGIQFQDKITQYDHWIAFFLLVCIGIQMIKESREQTEKIDDSFHFRTMLILSIATSIDALAVGISFAFFRIRIFFAACCIGVLTFFLSILGIKIGNVFGIKYKSKSEQIGGIILILIGLKILLEHLM